jgi:hypothetical protein
LGRRKICRLLSANVGFCRLLSHGGAALPWSLKFKVRSRIRHRVGNPDKSALARISPHLPALAGGRGGRRCPAVAKDAMAGWQRPVSTKCQRPYRLVPLIFAYSRLIPGGTPPPRTGIFLARCAGTRPIGLIGRMGWIGRGPLGLGKSKRQTRRREKHYGAGQTAALQNADAMAVARSCCSEIRSAELGKHRTSNIQRRTSKGRS